MAWSEKIESFLSCGIALHDSGISNWALSKDQALLAIDKFESQKLPVLGGDVYELAEGVPESNYDNWYCDKHEGESLDDFVYRSASQARQYVSNYRAPSGQDAFFVLVVNERVDH